MADKAAMMSRIRNVRDLTVPVEHKGLPFDVKAAEHSLNIDRRTCKREVPMEVLVLGLPRTSTVSMRFALFQLGYFDVYHGVAPWQENPPDAEMWLDAFRGKHEGGRNFTREDWDQLLGHCMAVTDEPCAHFAEELIQAYPEAKVILTVRDSASVWAASTRSTMMPLLNMEQEQTWLRRIKNSFMTPSALDLYAKAIEKYTGMFNFNDYEKFYEDHNALVQRLVPKDRLLVYNAKQGWKPLCEFLGKEIPSEPYPHLNKRDKFLQDADQFPRWTQDKLIVLYLTIGLGMAVLLWKGTSAVLTARVS